MGVIRELKRRYNTSLALGEVLPVQERGVPLPLSTGVPLYDAALLNKLAKTRTMDAAAHTNRAWSLVRKATREEREALADHAPGVLNDYKLLLALRAWDLGELELARRFVKALPWRWRLAFPTAVIKPAAAMLTGWRRRVSFRLVENPRWEELRKLFRETLEGAPGVVILKYRNTIQQSAALLRFRFEGPREDGIHDLAFESQVEVGHDVNLAPIPTFLEAKERLHGGDLKGFLDVLGEASAVIPITSYMGLLGNYSIRLYDERQPMVEELRDYAIRCATAVESLLRLNEWAPWLTEARMDRLATNVRGQVIERGLKVPFFKVVKAYMNCPREVREMALNPLLKPLLAHYGEDVRGLLGDGQQMTFLQPGNFVNLMSLLLYVVASAAMPTKLYFLKKDGVEEIPSLDRDEVLAHLAVDRRALESWLLREFGSLANRWEYTYDQKAIARTIEGLDPAEPLMLDLPFFDDIEVLQALLPREQVYNLNGAFGAPGEICLSYQYYAEFGAFGRGWSFGMYSRTGDTAATKFTELLDRLRWFRRLGGLEVQP